MLGPRDEGRKIISGRWKDIFSISPSFFLDLHVYLLF